MGLKQDIVISNQFGSKSPGRYIMRYTSRTDANDKACACSFNND